MRLVIVSNRLPVALARARTGQTRAVPVSGGLVTALQPVLRGSGGVWIGWPGTTDDENATLEPALLRETRDAGYRLVPVALTPEDRRDFYHGFSNEIIWPLFHDLLTACNFDPRYWASYLAVNQKFAQSCALHADPEDLIWVHDYHLMGVAAELRSLVPGCRPAFFLHTPFPPLDVFAKLPWRLPVLESLLAYSALGFQTPRDRRNFVQCVGALVSDIEIHRRGPVWTMRRAGDEVRVGAFPIGIDFDEFAQPADDDNIAAKTRGLRADEPGRQIVLGVDRLDYSKGLPHKLQAFAQALELYPDLRGRMTLVQVVVPSRGEIPEYAGLRRLLEQMVGEINGRFTRSGWVPIHYLFRALARPKLLAYYRAADVALVTPLKDGMNLVAKEYCAANLSEDGVLILSEFAGAAAQLQKGALIVNPFDVEGVARAIRQGVLMSPGERRLRMRGLRRSIREHSVYRWVGAFLRVAGGDGRRTPEGSASRLAVGGVAHGLSAH